MSARGGGGGPTGSELVGLGVLLAASVLVPLVVGIAIDGAAHTGPLFIFVGLIVGVAAACAVVYTRYISRYL
jgi:F0F1-type ATP synthase assembly protein I